MTFGVTPRARRARTIPKNPGSPEASTATRPDAAQMASSASSRRLISMRSAPSAVAGGFQVPGRAGDQVGGREGAGGFGAVGAAVTADHGDRGRAGHGPSWVDASRSCFLAWRSALRYPWKCPGWYRCERVPPAARAGTDEDQRVLPELAFLDARGEIFERAAHDQLIRPGHLVGDDARGVRRVAAGQQFVLQLTRARRRQEQRHRRAVTGEFGDLLARRHRGLAAAEPGQDHGLGDFRDRQLAPDPRGHGGEAGHPGDDLGVQVQRRALVELLLDGAPQRGITGVDAGHAELFPGGPLVVGQDALHRQPGGVHDLGVFPRVGQHVRVHQARGPDHHVGRGDDLRAAQGQQVRGAGAGPDERHAAPGALERVARPGFWQLSGQGGAAAGAAHGDDEGGQVRNVRGGGGRGSAGSAGSGTRRRGR